MAERVLIYGSRTWMDPEPIRALVNGLDDDAVVISGGAAGADFWGMQAARQRGLAFVVYPAQWGEHGKAAGPIRNQQMLDEGKPTRAVGFRSTGRSTGTDDMTRRLVKAGVPHEVVTDQD